MPLYFPVGDTAACYTSCTIGPGGTPCIATEAPGFFSQKLQGVYRKDSDPNVFSMRMYCITYLYAFFLTENYYDFLSYEQNDETAIEVPNIKIHILFL